MCCRILHRYKGYFIQHYVAFYPRYSSLGYTDEERAEVAKQLLSLSQASFINQTKFIHPFTLGLLYLSFASINQEM